MENKKIYKKGYTTGVYDLFHIGHLNIIRNAKRYCEELVVGVSTDDLVKKRKNKTPFIPFIERVEIVATNMYVDNVVKQDDMNKLGMVKSLECDVVFVGNDWEGHPTWIEYEKEFNQIGVDVVYLAHTDHTSSTKLQQILNLKIKNSIT